MQDLTPVPLACTSLRAASLRAAVGQRRAERDEPHREGGAEVEVEPQHDEIDRAMDGAVQGAKSHEDPGGGYVPRIHLIGDEEIEHERIEKHRNLEQVLEVVRGIGHSGQRELGEGTGTARSFALLWLGVRKLMRRMLAGAFPSAKKR